MINMKSLTCFLRTTALCSLLLTVVGCASSGPKYSELNLSQSPPSAGQGRILLYRTTVMGAAVQPQIQVNGEAIGKATPRGFHKVDRPPGTYEIVTSTEVTRKLSLLLDPGQTRYVRLNIGMGFFVGHVYPELIDPVTGEKEIQSCHLIPK